MAIFLGMSIYMDCITSLQDDMTLIGSIGRLLWLDLGRV